MQIMQTMTDIPTTFTFIATREDGSFIREFENKEETWARALYDFVQFLKGMGFIIEDEDIQIRDMFVPKDSEPVYTNLFDAIYY